MKINVTVGSLMMFGLFGTGIALADEQGSSTSGLVLTSRADAAVRTDLDVRRNDNYGCDAYVIVGTGRAGEADAMRSLVRFDLSSIVQATIASARLEMTLHSFDNGSTSSVYRVDVHRVVPSGQRTPWVEGNGTERVPAPPGCVGVDPAFGVAWAGQGDNPDPDAANNITQPDFAPVTEATSTVNQATAMAGDIFQWDVTSVVQGWLNGTILNYGLLLRDTSTDGIFRGARFGAREGNIFGIPGAVNGPRLVLTFSGHAAIMICHIPPGNPENAHTIIVDASAVTSHLAHGDVLGACQR